MLRRVLRWVTVGAFCSTAATCGQKGPLELPDERAALAVVWPTTSAVRNPGTGDHKGRAGDRKGRAGDRKGRAGDHKGRPYGDVSGHSGSVCPAGREADGLRA